MSLFYRILVLGLFFWVFGGSAIVIYFQAVDGALIRKPIVFSIDPMDLQTDKAVYKRGEGIKVRLAYCKYYQYHAETTWRIINETVITFPTKISGVANTGCFGVDKPLWAEVVIVPDRAVTGTHHLEGTSAIQVNNLKTVFINFKSQDFEVVD